MMTSKTFIQRDDRRPVAMHGFALGPDRDSDVALSDMSYGGCRIHSADSFSEGEIVELRIIKVGATSAEVRWADEGRAGVKFLS
jgi:hypothetical protein